MTGPEFKAARKARALDQVQMASWLKASYSAVTKWETGKNPIPEWVAEKLGAPSGTFHVEGLSADEILALQRLAATQGLRPETLIADLIRAGLKFAAPPIIALAAGLALYWATTA